MHENVFFWGENCTGPASASSLKWDDSAKTHNRSAPPKGVPGGASCLCRGTKW